MRCEQCPDRLPYFCRRPTFAETKRVARILACVYLVEQPATTPSGQVKAAAAAPAGAQAEGGKAEGAAAGDVQQEAAAAAREQEQEVVPPPRLHRAVLSGDADKVMSPSLGLCLNLPAAACRGREVGPAVPPFCFTLCS